MIQKFLKIRNFLFAFVLVLAARAQADGPVLPGQAPGAGQPAVPGTAPAGAGAAPPPGGTMGMMLPMIIMFAVVYFLMIRPQQKKVKEQQKLIGALAHGDEIVTSSGILGKITGIAERVVTLEVSDGVKIKILKSQVAQVIKGQIKELA
jgi:preprotein translocase subunit YajC